MAANLYKLTVPQVVSLRTMMNAVRDRTQRLDAMCKSLEHVLSRGADLSETNLVLCHHLNAYQAWASANNALIDATAKSLSLINRRVTLANKENRRHLAAVKANATRKQRKAANAA